MIFKETKMILSKKFSQQVGRRNQNRSAEDLQIKKVKKKKKKKQKRMKNERPKMYSKSIQTICSGLLSDVESKKPEVS